MTQWLCHIHTSFILLVQSVVCYIGKASLHVCMKNTARDLAECCIYHKTPPPPQVGLGNTIVWQYTMISWKYRYSNIFYLLLWYYTCKLLPFRNQLLYLLSQEILATDHSKLSLQKGVNTIILPQSNDSGLA